VLYNRIDQQVELINVLKQRLDEITRRWERSVAEADQQEIERSKLQQSLNSVSHQHANLQLRWEQLSANHTEMIALKDDYKDKCRVLKERVRQLESGEHTAVKVEKSKGVELQKRVTELQEAQKTQLSYEITLHEKIKALEDRITTLLGLEADARDQIRQQQKSHEQIVVEYELNIKEETDKINILRTENATLSSQVQNLTQEIINRGKLVQDKDTLIKKLECDKDKLNTKNGTLNKDLIALKDSINSNRVVKELRDVIVNEKEGTSV